MDQTVAILMCTHNGEKFLQEQIDSIISQTYRRWHLYVYDDASSDNTEKIVRQYQNQYPDTIFFTSVSYKHFAKNFLSAVCSVPNKYSFYAFSDQDDIWMNDKIENAITALKQLDNNIPSLYCTRTTLVDVNAQYIGLSPLFKKPPSFKNAIVQSIAGGNTMVFNNAAHSVICKAGAKVDIVSHDWWVYQLISGAGGNVIYDPSPSLLYRQHSNNLIGSNIGMMARFKRIGMLIHGRFRSWNNQNIVALKGAKLLSNENDLLVKKFESLRTMNILSRIVLFIRCGFYRQTFLGNIGLIVGVILNKV